MNKLFLVLLTITTQAVLAQQPSAEIAEKLKNAKAGDELNLAGFIDQKFDKIAYDKMVLPGPQYIIADDPEYIREAEAIAVKETVQPGSVRLYVYNVNGVKEPQIPRKITAVIKNTGKSTLHLRMVKYSSQPPSDNYYLIGKQGLHDYYASQGSTKIIKVKPGKTAAIDPQLEKNVVQFNELTHGLYEFTIDQPAEIAVLQTAPSNSGPQAYETINNVIPTNAKNAGRGLFGVSNYWITSKKVLSTDEPASQIIVADGKDDPWVHGVEGVSGKPSELAGNYGVMYNVELNWKSTNGKGLALVTWNAQTHQQWCQGMANSILIKNGNKADEIVSVPRDQLNTKGAPNGVVVQIFKPDPNKEIQTLKLTYSPPGASCLPTPLIFVPIEL